MSPPLPALAGSLGFGLYTGLVGQELTDSPAGAYPSGKLGEEPRGKPGNLLPLLAQIAIGREKSDLKIFGNDYPTPYVLLSPILAAGPFCLHSSLPPLFTSSSAYRLTADT